MIDEPQARELLTAGETIADIGQLTSDAKRMLARNVKAGRVERFSALWGGVAMKNHYRIAETD